MKNVPGPELGQSVPQPMGADLPPSEDETAEHLHHLVKAHEIATDPTKMAAVHALVGRHNNAVKGIKSVQGLKDHYQSKYGPKAPKQPKTPSPAAQPAESDLED